MENEKTTKTEKKTAGSCPSAMTCYQFFFPLFLLVFFYVFVFMPFIVCCFFMPLVFRFFFVVIIFPALARSTVNLHSAR